MVKKFFGTDGIRGIANTGNITADIAMKLASAAGTIFTKEPHKRHLVVIGKDTRLSSYLLESALTAGFIATGMDVLLVGPLPTPAISMLTKSLRADLGIMISASHNTYEYNGIKIFDSAGIKLDNSTEILLEELILEYPQNILFSKPANLGKVSRLDDAAGRYIEFAKNTFPKDQTLSGIKILLDSANGAAYHLSEKIFWELGAEVIHIGNKPNGTNINKDCGSTNIHNLQKAVLECKADVGIALDGDADRVIMVDQHGMVIDGDKILASIATYMKSKDKLKDNTVVATTMSNIGLERYLASQGISLTRTDVGDKNVLKEMLESQYSLGGEKSGHILLPEFSSTGDGIVAALQVLAYVIESKCMDISDLCDKYTPIPQKIFNIKYDASIDGVLNKASVKGLIADISSRLDSSDSRLIVRKSGTEPLIRFMVETSDKNVLSAIAKILDSFEVL